MAKGIAFRACKRKLSGEATFRLANVVELVA
jgi:hypothetical protein